MACTGRPPKALEDDVRDEGVDIVTATLQAKMMPSGEKIVFCHCQKNLLRFGVRLLVDKMSHRTNRGCEGCVQDIISSDKRANIMSPNTQWESSERSALFHFSIGQTGMQGPEHQHDRHRRRQSTVRRPTTEWTLELDAKILPDALILPTMLVFSSHVSR